MNDFNLSDEATISLLINILNDRFNELCDPLFSSDDFVLGEIAAYTECYNMVRAWSGATAKGFDAKYISTKDKIKL